MGYNIALNFEDGVTRFVRSRPGETVADASYRVGINIPLDCRDGACGTCKCRVQSGDYDPGSYIEDALTEEEAAQGLALACQMRPKTDLVIDIAASSEACKTKGQSFQARLSRWSGCRRRRSTLVARRRRAASASCRASMSTSWCPAPTASAPIPSARRPARRIFVPRPRHPARRDEHLPAREGGAGRDRWRSPALPAASTCARSGARCCSSPAAPASRHSCRCSAGLPRPARPYPVHMVYGVTNDADLVGVEQLEAVCRAHSRLHLHHLRRGARPAPIRARATSRATSDAGHAERRRRRYLSLWPAADGRRGPRLARRTGHRRPANFYYEKFAPSGAVTTIGETHRQAA